MESVTDVLMKVTRKVAAGKLKETETDAAMEAVTEVSTEGTWDVSLDTAMEALTEVSTEVLTKLLTNCSWKGSGKALMVVSSGAATGSEANCCKNRV